MRELLVQAHSLLRIEAHRRSLASHVSNGVKGTRITTLGRSWNKIVPATSFGVFGGSWIASSHLYLRWNCLFPINDLLPDTMATKTFSYLSS